MKTNILIGIAAFSVMLFMYGCMDPINTTENTEKTMKPDFLATKRIVTDGYLENRLKLMSVDKVTLPDGLLKIQVTMKSTRTGFWDWIVRGNTPYRIGYRFEWFDQNGMAVDTASSVWLEKDIIAGDTIFLQSVAPNERCKDFLLRLKELEYK